MKNLANKSSYKSQFTRFIIDLEDFKKRLNFKENHGVCGSMNLGNTCFMNSSIACLSNCSELTYYFLSETYEDHINKNNIDGTQGKLAKEWYNLLVYYWTTHNECGSPKKIKNF